MSRHDHPEAPPSCGHEMLKYCRMCDTVECLVCGAEFVRPLACTNAVSTTTANVLDINEVRLDMERREYRLPSWVG